MTSYDHLTDTELVREARDKDGLVRALAERLEMRASASVFSDIETDTRLGHISLPVPGQMELELQLFTEEGKNVVAYFFALLEDTTMTAQALGVDLDAEWSRRRKARYSNPNQSEMF